MDYEVVSRIAERIADHDISARRLADWKCPYCGISGDGMDEWAHHVAREIVLDLSVERENQWIPHLQSGEACSPLHTFHDAELAMKISGEVVRVDREWRFVSRWFNPSRNS